MSLELSGFILLTRTSMLMLLDIFPLLVLFSSGAVLVLPTGIFCWCVDSDYVLFFFPFLFN